MKKFNTEQPDAEDAKVTQKTQKKDKRVFVFASYSVNDNAFVSMNLAFLLRPLRNLCVFCVRKFLSPLQQLQPGAPA
jgi:hypothetical protein